jgi:hypothetical protein
MSELNKKKQNLTESMYDVICGKIQEALRIYSFARLNTEYTPTIIGQNACTTSTIGPTRLHPDFGQMACVCKRFRDVLTHFRAKKVEFVESHITSDLLQQSKRVIYNAFIMTHDINVEWELMYKEQKIYRIRAYRFDGWLTCLGTSQKGDSKLCRSIRVEEAAIEGMPLEALVQKRDAIVNLLMQELQTWPTLTPLSGQDCTTLVTYFNA